MDLLLDTICNTFGGVLFIAILVVMLVQTSPASREQPSQASNPGAAERLPQLVSELEVLTEEFDRAQAAWSGQLRTLAALAPREIRQLLVDRRQKQDSEQSLKNERSRLEALIARMAESVSATHSAALAAKADLRRTQAEVEKLENELAAARAAKVKELKTPVAKRPGFRTEVGFVIQYGRFYVWHRYDSTGVRRGLNTDDFLVVGEDAKELETTPRPTRGVPIEKTPASRAKLAAVIGRFSPGRHYATFVVRPDSYDDFEVVRDVAIDLGLEYRLMPLQADSTIRDRGGSGGFVQ